MDPVVAAADLVVGADCPVCGRPALSVCPTCRPTLRPAPERVLALRHRAVPVVAAGPYAGGVRDVVVAWKEQDRHPLTPLLSARLAAALVVLIDTERLQGPLTLVPVPTTWRARARRGVDLVGRLATESSTLLADVGLEVPVRRVLRHRRRPVDQAGLGAVERAANLHGALTVGRRVPTAELGKVLLVDDVVTTGATLAEAARALRRRGVPVGGAAVVAATPGRSHDGSRPPLVQRAPRG